jgi:formate-dependent nitrite reductase cytochrome c552 subunit
MNKKIEVVYDLDLNITWEEVSEEERKLAEMYWNTMVVKDTATRATVSNIRSQVAIVPCNGWCCDSGKTTWVLRHAGNDVKVTSRLYMENMEHALHASCRACADKYFKLAEVLDQHLNMLLCRKANDERGAMKAINKRGELLKQLGYIIA